MVKKIIWIVLVAVLLLGASYYFLFFKQVFERQDPLALLPPDAALIWEINDPNEQIGLLETDSIWFKLNEYAPVNKLFKELRVLNRIVKTDNGDDFLDNARVFATMQKASANNMGIIYIIEHTKNKLSNFKSMAKSDSLSVNQSLYKGHAIKKVKEYGTGTEMSLAAINGIIVASAQPFLVEELIGRLNNKDVNSPIKSSSFKEALLYGSKNRDLKVYVNFANLPLYLSIFSDQMQMVSNSEMVNIAEWAVIDLKITANSIYLNGYLITDQDKSFLNNLLEVNGENSEVLSVLPSNTAIHYSITTNSFDPPFPSNPKQ